MKTNFLLGQLKLTEPARMALKRQPYDLLARHAINDYGNVTSRERKANEEGMLTAGKILSRYKVDPSNPRSKNVVICTATGWTETVISIE